MLSNLRSEKVFAYFEELSKVPRGSFHNEKICRYLVSFAKEKGLSYSVDEALNVVIRKPATEGYELCNTVILQGHMDMVCECEQGTEHDFENEPIDLYEEGDFIHARGTTLGADDGIGVAMALAILDSDEYEHPALEVVITTDEEVGMLGAAALDLSMLKGKQMINLDSEEEGTLLVSCAGGMTAKADFPSHRTVQEGVLYQVCISGLKGGHSGCDIQDFRLNANKLLGRLLFQCKEKCSIVELMGGTADNVITRDALALVRTCSENFRNFCEKSIDELKREYETWEPELNITIDVVEDTGQKGFEWMQSRHIIDFINLVPQGVQVMSKDVGGLVESSLNMGVMQSDEEAVKFGFSIRSQKKSYKEFLYGKVSTVTSLFGGICRREGEYPSWDYKKDSMLRDVMCRVFEQQYGKAAHVTGIHAGLECGIFYDGVEDMDIVSIGADTFDIHSPKERLSISSTKRVFSYLTAVLKELGNLSIE